MAEDAKTTVKVLGKDLELIVKKSGDAVATMRKGDFDAILADKGVTKEVRETITKAQDEIISEVHKFETDYLLKTNKGKKEDAEGFVKSIETRLGSGDGSMELRLDMHKVHTGKDIKTGAPYTTNKYGVFKVTVNKMVAKELRKEGGELDKTADAIMKMMGGKK